MSTKTFTGIDLNVARIGASPTEERLIAEIDALRAELAKASARAEHWKQTAIGLWVDENSHLGEAGVAEFVADIESDIEQEEHGTSN